MRQQWTSRRVPIKFQLSDKTLFVRRIQLQVREADLCSKPGAEADLRPPHDPLEAGCEGFLIRSQPVAGSLPTLTHRDGFLRYVPSQYQRQFIDLNQSFDDYKRQFSSKSRSTIQRKVKKFAEHGGGGIEWRAYSRADQMAGFFQAARQVSAKTYQEKLLDAGLPDSPEYCRQLETLAHQGQVCAYLLFDRGTPVSYLCCPVADGVVKYQYLGYDPEYARLSVGTVLQWLALEHLFNAGRFRLFDFTEGDSGHKQLFATHSIRCANVFFLRATLRNRILLQAQIEVDRLSSGAGAMLEQLGCKAQVKKLLRSGRLS